MADWGILRNSTGKDFLSLCGHEISSIHQMMGDLDFTHGTVFSGQDSSQVDENTFCTVDNEEQCISYLNQELLSLGFMSLSFEGRNKTTSLINRLYELLRLYQKHGRVKEEMENRLHRVTTQSDHYQSSVSRLKNDIEKLKREVCREQEKYRQIAVKQKSLSTKLKAEKDEVKRLHAVLKDRDAQYKHELKKKERESNKLKEKIHQLLADKTPNRRVGLDMAYSIQSSDGKRSTWKTSGNNKQEEMYQYLVTTYEDRQKELMVENAELRDSISRIQKDITKALRLSTDGVNSPSSNKNGMDSLEVHGSESEEDGEESGAENTGKVFPHGYLQMPYEIIRDHVEHSTRDRCRRIKEKKKARRKLPSPRSSKTSPSKPSPVTNGDLSDKQREDLDKINRQIEKYKDIIQQQELLIKQFIESQSESAESKSFLHDSRVLQEWESLTEQKRLFYTEKANFEKERKQLTEEAIRVGKERRAIEDEKTSILRTQFLQISPLRNNEPPYTSPGKGGGVRLLPATPIFSPLPLHTEKRPVTSAKGKSRSTKRLKKSDSARLLPSTPLFSPAPSGPPKTPSTAELMKFLGLSKDLNSSNRSTPLSHIKGSELQRSASAESLVKANSKSPADLNESSNQDENTNAKKTLFRRRSSTGSNEDLGV